MNITFLGTGTSVGVPMIGCDCSVCTSSDHRNKRRRTSISIEAGGLNIVVDTPPDFRDQALEFRIKRVDAVIFTHSHADHIFGFDNIRRFNTIQGNVIPAYGLPATIADLKRIFNYIGGSEEMPGMFRPRIEFKEIDGHFNIGPFKVIPLPVVHGSKPTAGYLFDADGRKLAYVPDCARMSDEIVNSLQGIDMMILDALRHRPHKTHLTVTDSLALLGRIAAKRSYLIHMCHELDHDETEKGLAGNPSIRLSYDGLALEV